MKAKGHTARFKGFCKSETMDTFLHACIDYFTVFFEVKKIEDDEGAAAEKRRDALASGERPSEGSIRTDSASGAPSHAGSPPSKELQGKEIEQRARLRDLALVYAAILLKHSNYANTQQERQFFESLYDFSKRVLFTINNRKHWHAIENELDRVFRSPHFNLSERKNKANAQGGGTAMTSFKDLYEKAGGAEVRTPPLCSPLSRSHGSRALALSPPLATDLAPAERAGGCLRCVPQGFGRALGASSHRSSNIHKALLMRSPIISEIFPTPKERAERAAQTQADLFDQHTEEMEDEAAARGSSNQAALRSSGRTDGAGSTRDGRVGSAQPVYLDGEEAMEALVQETSRSFTDIVNTDS